MSPTCIVTLTWNKKQCYNPEKHHCGNFCYLAFSYMSLFNIYAINACSWATYFKNCLIYVTKQRPLKNKIQVRTWLCKHIHQNRGTAYYISFFVALFYQIFISHFCVFLLLHFFLEIRELLPDAALWREDLDIFYRQFFRSQNVGNGELMLVFHATLFLYL